MQLNPNVTTIKPLPPDDTVYIEQEFQDYFKVLLHKQDEDCYFVPEWETHFEWGNRRFTLKQLKILLNGHRHLASIVPEIQSFSWLRNLSGH